MSTVSYIEHFSRVTQMAAVNFCPEPQLASYQGSYNWRNVSISPKKKGEKLAPVSGRANDPAICTWRHGTFSLSGFLVGSQWYQKKRGHFSYLGFGLLAGTHWRNWSFLPITMLGIGSYRFCENSLRITYFPLEGMVPCWS